MKIKNMLFLGICCILCLTGCGKKEENNSQVSVTELMDTVNEEIESVFAESGGQANYMRVDLAADEGKDLAESIELDADKVEEAILLMNPMNVNADKFVIAKAQEEDDVDDIIAAFENLKQQQLSEWEFYLPAQYEKVQNNIIKANGKYVFYITYDEPEKMLELVEKKL